MTLLCRIEPQPPQGIKYLLGEESWLDADKRTPLRLCCEEWGNLGSAELNSEILPNPSGFRVRISERIAPVGATGFEMFGGVYWWTSYRK